MRAIETKEKLEKKRKIKVAIISFFMLFIMVLSTIGFAFMSNNDSADNSQPATNNNNRISFEYANQEITLRSTYDDVKNISTNISSTLLDLNGKNIYVSSKNQGILQELSILNLISQRFQEGCYGKCDENLPEKNCTSNLIVWKESLDNKVYQEENCIFIEGDMRAADAFIYSIFGSPLPL